MTAERLAELGVTDLARRVGAHESLSAILQEFSDMSRRTTTTKWLIVEDLMTSFESSIGASQPEKPIGQW